MNQNTLQLSFAFIKAASTLEQLGAFLQANPAVRNALIGGATGAGIGGLGSMLAGSDHVLRNTLLGGAAGAGIGGLGTKLLENGGGGDAAAGHDASLDKPSAKMMDMTEMNLPKPAAGVLSGGDPLGTFNGGNMLAAGVPRKQLDLSTFLRGGTVNPVLHNQLVSLNRNFEHGYQDPREAMKLLQAQPESLMGKLREMGNDIKTKATAAGNALAEVPGQVKDKVKGSVDNAFDAAANSIWNLGQRSVGAQELKTGDGK